MKNVYVLANVIKKKKLFKIYLSLEIPKKNLNHIRIKSTVVQYPFPQYHRLVNLVVEL